MSASVQTKALTPPAIAARKGGTPFVCLTAYTTPMARLVDPHCELVLVGDSVGMVLHGLPSTLGVSLDKLEILARASIVGMLRPTNKTSAA